jgi:hypothetical protein
MGGSRYCFCSTLVAPWPDSGLESSRRTDSESGLRFTARGTRNFRIFALRWSCWVSFETVSSLIGAFLIVAWGVQVAKSDHRGLLHETVGTFQLCHPHPKTATFSGNTMLLDSASARGSRAGLAVGLAGGDVLGLPGNTFPGPLGAPRRDIPGAPLEVVERSLNNSRAILVFCSGRGGDHLPESLRCCLKFAAVSIRWCSKVLPISIGLLGASRGPRVVPHTCANTTHGDLSARSAEARRALRPPCIVLAYGGVPKPPSTTSPSTVNV